MATGTPAPPRPKLSPVEELRALDLDRRLGTYQARGAAWAAGQPVVVARDYDFELAASLHHRVGPALAASRRRDENRELAGRFERMAPIAVDRLLDALLEQCGGACPALGAATARLYAVVYGAEPARLRLVLETADAAGSARQFVSIGAARAAAGFTDSAVLHAELAEGLVQLRELLTAAGTTPAALALESATGRCGVGGVEGISGRVLSSTVGHVALEVQDDLLPTQAICPRDAFRAVASRSPASGAGPAPAGPP